MLVCQSQRQYSMLCRVNLDSLAAYELSAIQNALFKCDGHRKNAANMLGIGEATLYRKLNKYKL